MSKQKSPNITKAGATGAVAGTGGGVLIAWLSNLAASKWGMPLEVAATIISPVFGFAAAVVMRWAARLNPSGGG